MRFNLTPWDIKMPDAYAFVEYSRRHTNQDPVVTQPINGDRIFAGALVRY